MDDTISKGQVNLDDAQNTGVSVPSVDKGQTVPALDNGQDFQPDPPVLSLLDKLNLIFLLDKLYTIFKERDTMNGWLVNWQTTLAGIFALVAPVILHGLNVPQEVLMGVAGLVMAPVALLAKQGGSNLLKIVLAGTLSIAQFADGLQLPLWAHIAAGVVSYVLLHVTTDASPKPLASAGS
jgi:hypothetical protein